MESDTIDVSSTTTHVVRKVMEAVVSEAGPVAGVEPEQSVQCRALQLQQALLHRWVDTHGARLGVHRLLEPGCCLPRGRGQGKEGRSCARRRRLPSRRANARATVVVLPVPGPPAMTEKRRRTAVTAARDCRSDSWAAGNSIATSAAGAPSSTPAGECAARSSTSFGDQDFVGPEPVEVEVRSHQMQREVVTDQRAGRHAGEPERGVGPGQRAEIRPAIGVGDRRGGDGGQVDADVAQSRRTRRQGRAQAHHLVREPRRRARVTATWTSDVDRMPAG